MYPFANNSATPPTSPLTSGLVTWHDGADTSTIVTEPGGRVIQWLDKIGNNHATQGSGLSSRPFYGQRTLNGFQCLDFQGGQHLNLANALPQASGDSTILMVAKSDSTTAAQILSNNHNTGSLQNGYFLSVNTGGPHTCSSLSQLTGTGIINQSYYGNSISLDTACYGSIRQGTSNTVLYNGIKGVSNTAGDYTSGTCFYGARNSTSGPLGLFDGIIAESLIYDRVLSDSEIMQVFSYLKYKWGIVDKPPLNGIWAWLDGSDTSTITLDTNDRVISWADKSGNNRNASTASAGVRPYYNMDTLNDLGVISFQGAEYMTLPNGQFIGSGDSTVFAVTKRNPTAIGQRTILNGYMAPNITIAYLFITGRTTFGTSLYHSASNAAVDFADAGQSSVEPQISVGFRNGTTINVLSDTSGNLIKSSSAPATNLTLVDNMWIGARRNYPATSLLAAMDGYLAELIIYDRALNDDEAKQVVRYLRDKWDLNPVEFRPNKP